MSDPPAKVIWRAGGTSIINGIIPFTMDVSFIIYT